MSMKIENVGKRNEDQRKVVKLVAFIWLIPLSCKFCSVATNLCMWEVAVWHSLK